MQADLALLPPSLEEAAKRENAEKRKRAQNVRQALIMGGTLAKKTKSNITGWTTWKTRYFALTIRMYPPDPASSMSVELDKWTHVQID
jgi:hypothetical protein